MVLFIQLEAETKNTDKEMPKVRPGPITRIYFNITNDSLVYPDDINVTEEKNLANLKVENPEQTAKKYFDTFEYRVKMTTNDILNGLQNIAILFSYKVSLRKWAKADVTGYGAFSFDSPISFNKIVATGALNFDQLVPLDYASVYQNSHINENPDIITVSDGITANHSDDILFYVHWDTISPYFGHTDILEIRLRIKVKEVDVIHSIPLASYLEGILVTFLSCFTISRFVVNLMQGLCFRNRILKTWVVKLSASPKDD